MEKAAKSYFLDFSATSALSVFQGLFRQLIAIRWMLLVVKDWKRRGRVETMRMDVNWVVCYNFVVVYNSHQTSEQQQWPR